MNEYSISSSSNKPSIHILLGDITSRGGIERVSITLANALGKLYHVRLISLYASHKEMAFRHNSDVVITYLNEHHEESMYNRVKPLLPGIIFDFKYLLRKKRILKKAKLPENNAIAICCDVKMTLLAKMAGYKKIIAIEHFEYDVINAVLKKIRKALYKKIDATVTLTPEDKQKYSWIPKEKHFVIPNIVEMPNVISAFQQRENQVLAVGRLTHQKGFDLLLQAWRHVDVKDWSLKIIGDGPDRDKLNDYIKNNHLSNVVIKPFQKNINEEYNNAKIFVLSSRYEGWGMVLVEALAYGMACISFNCPAGPKTILKKENGILVNPENVIELAKELNDLIKNNDLQQKLSQVAQGSIVEYSAKEIVLQWQKVIEQVNR